MSMRLWINGTLITNFILSTPFKDTIDEELDQLNFQIKSDTRLNYKKNDKVGYSIWKGNTTVLTKTFCIFEILETWDGEKWLYQVSCLSPTKLLENITINGMAMTEELSSLYAQMQIVLQKINSQQSYEGESITLSLTASIDGDNINDLTDYPISEFIWDGEVNAREIFNDMVEKADCIITAYDYTISNNKISSISLQAVKREKKGTQIVNSANSIDNGAFNSVKKYIKGMQVSFDSEYKVGNIESLVKNAITNKIIETGWQGARNIDITIDDASKWQIITKEPIYSLDKVVLKMVAYTNNQYTWIDLIGDNQSHTITFNNLIVNIDITKYIVEKMVFDVLPLTEQRKSLYFIRGQRNIYGLVDRYKVGNTGLFSSTAIQLILADILGSQAKIDAYISIAPLQHLALGSESIEQLESLDTYLSEDETYQDHHGSTYLNTTRVSANLNSIDPSYAKTGLFNVKYIPYVDSVVKLTKTNINDINARSENLSTIKNQSDRTIDAKKYYDSQQSLINRMGNEIMHLDCIIDLADNNATIWNLGDYFTIQSKDWTITQRKISNYNGTLIKANFTLSKSFNASNVDIQMNRDKRLYGIPLNNYIDRYIIIKKSGLSVANNGKIGIKCYDDFSGVSVIDGYCVNNVITIGNDNIIDKISLAQDNYAVDTIRSYKENTWVNVPIRYCDADTGKLTNMTLRYFTQAQWDSIFYSITECYKLPFITKALAESVGTEVYLPLIYKDKMERLIFIFK